MHGTCTLQRPLGSTVVQQACSRQKAASAATSSHPVLLPRLLVGSAGSRMMGLAGENGRSPLQSRYWPLGTGLCGTIKHIIRANCHGMFKITKKLSLEAGLPLRSLHCIRPKHGSQTFLPRLSCIWQCCRHGYHPCHCPSPKSGEGQCCYPMLHWEQKAVSTDSGELHPWRKRSAGNSS